MVETPETTRSPEPIWRCLTKGCDRSYPPTLHGFNQMTGHQIQHSKEGLSAEERIFRLIEKNTGEVLAETLKEAMAKELLALKEGPVEIKSTPIPTPTIPALVPEVPKMVEIIPPALQKPLKEKPVEPPEVEPPEVEPLEEAPTEEATKAKVTIVKTAGTFTYEITLPADAFTLFNLAKACGLEPNDGKLFDEWVWDCIRARFAKDYKKQLILAPLEA